MTQTEWKPRTKGIIDIVPEEIEDFELQVKRFQSGDFDPTEFQAYRLKQGIYGQRQPDAQMVRVKVPFGGLTADQLDALGVAAREFAPLNKGHVTTRENFQFHHVVLDDTPGFMRVLADVGLTTREACGNTVRNVTGCRWPACAPTSLSTLRPTPPRTRGTSSAIRTPRPSRASSRRPSRAVRGTAP